MGPRPPRSAPRPAHRRLRWSSIQLPRSPRQRRRPSLRCRICDAWLCLHSTCARRRTIVETLPPMETVLLCRYGEIFLKSGNRKRFERVLVDNVRAALAGIAGARVQAPYGRVLVTLPAAAADEAAARLERVFGLVSFSVARAVPADVEAIAAAAVEEARAGMARARPASFRIDARRADKRFPLNSIALARAVGARVAAATGLPVDLHEPGLRVGV